MSLQQFEHQCEALLRIPKGLAIAKTPLADVPISEHAEIAFGHWQPGRRLKLLFLMDFHWHGSCIRTLEEKRCATHVSNRR